MLASYSTLILLLVAWASHEETLIAGKTLHEWQTTISKIDLQAPESRRYVPGLMALMDDPQVPWITRRQAALTLGRLGPLARDAIPAVMAHLNEVHLEDPETSPQRWALSALALFGREAPEAAPRLARMLADEKNSIVTRLGCLEALSQIGPASQVAIPALWQELERHLSQAAEPADHDLAVGAAEALGMVGPDAAVAVPVLIRAAQASSNDLRREAIRAMGRIGPAAQDAQSYLCDAMVFEESPLLRDVAMTALQQTGPTAWPLVEPLLSTDEVEARERAVTVVATWKSQAELIIPKIKPLVDDENPHVRLAVARSLYALSRRHEMIWSMMIELLDDPDRHIRRGASRLMQEISTSSEITEVELQQLLSDPRPKVRSEGIRLQRLLKSSATNPGK